MKRLNPRSLRVRLTVWYSCALLLVGIVLAGASQWAMAVSMNRALDQGLRHRLIGLHAFMDDNGHDGLDRLTQRLRELDHLGDLFQVFGPNGECLAQSDGLSRHRVSRRPPPDPGAGMLFRTTGPHWFPVRMATQRIYVGGIPLTVEVADPQRKFAGVLRDFDSFLFVALPIVLALAALGGYWLSGRALGPVDQIIDEARAMDPANLGARLSVPASGDELQRLSETLNQMLARVEQSVQQVRRFTADASHELRAPMTLIYTAAQVALRRVHSPDELNEYWQKVLREAKRCTELINQLLWLARSDAGSSRIELASTDIVAVVRDVVDEVMVLAADKGLNISSSFPETSMHAMIDEISFRRMLVILLDNAIKYTPAAGAISVRVMADGGYLAISVQDTGPGIPADDLPFIFDRFWRADKVRSRDAGGTGLGLAIAREIAERHHATITVGSLVGQGSTFTVRLERAVPERIQAPTSNEVHV